MPDPVYGDKYALIRYSENSAERIWEEDVCGFPGPVEEDVKIMIEDTGFVSLAPGEIYTTLVHFYPLHDFENEFLAGERYSFRYYGREISWWDWGTFEVFSVLFLPRLNVSRLSSSLFSI